MGNPAHGHLGLHSLSPDVGHDLAAAFGGYGIGHRWSSPRRGFADKPFKALEVDHAAIFPKTAGDELRRKMYGDSQCPVRLRRGAIAQLSCCPAA